MTLPAGSTATASALGLTLSFRSPTLIMASVLRKASARLFQGIVRVGGATAAIAQLTGEGHAGAFDDARHRIERERHRKAAFQERVHILLHSGLDLVPGIHDAIVVIIQSLNQKLRRDLAVEFGEDEVRHAPRLAAGCWLLDAGSGGSSLLEQKPQQEARAHADEEAFNHGFFFFANTSKGCGVR
jgi:hypothetical protein